jgi:hypothetical protein
MLKSSKQAHHLSSTPLNGQLERLQQQQQHQQQHQQIRDNSDTTTPLVDTSLLRQNPHIMGEPPDGDDTDPDVIPNQYGELLLMLLIN